MSVRDAGSVRSLCVRVWGPREGVERDTVDAGTRCFGRPRDGMSVVLGADLSIT